MSSLSSRLLLLTILFVMLSEVAVFAPSVARFRVDWLTEKLGSAHLAILALDATPDGMVSDDLRAKLLNHVGAVALIVHRDNARLVLSEDMPPEVEANYDLTEATPLTLVADAFETMSVSRNRVIRVRGTSPNDPAVTIDLVLDEWPLYMALIDFAWRIFWLSLGISIVTATLVFLTLQWLMVRPMKRITASMVAFDENPDDASQDITPGRRSDEIGVAQRQLAEMQRNLRAALRQKEHLAALGVAVAKINHDLRGILSTALLVSDRLAESEDPQVRKTYPTLVNAIERAIKLCSNTLEFVGKDQGRLERESFRVRPLVEDVSATIVWPRGHVGRVENAVPEDLILSADREQIFRMLSNLLRNAAEAKCRAIAVSAEPTAEGIRIDVADDGPGLPPKAREKLFQPFEGSARAGGSGLGLVIAQDIAHAHGGSIELVGSDVLGTRFRICLPKGMERAGGAKGGPPERPNPEPPRPERPNPERTEAAE